MATIEVNDLSKVYRLYPGPGARLAEVFTGRPRHSECVALDGVDFRIDRGATVGVIGRNGSGKSTLLRILAGIIDPTLGSYRIEGRVVPLLELGAGFIPELTGEQNIVLNGRLLGMSKAEAVERAPAVLEFAQLGPFARQPLRTYSAGMQLRLGFAVAQSLDPDVLLVDEVLAVGDITFQRKCLARIEEIKAAGATVLIVTHSLADVAGLCDYTIQLDAGKIVRQGSTEDVVREYIEDMENPSQAGAPVFDSHNPHRRTTGEITIESVELLDSGGNAASTFETGDGARLRLSYKVGKQVENPMFRVRIFRMDGLMVHGSNTYRHGIDSRVVDGDGMIEVRYEALNLIPGRYWINVSVHPDEYGKALAEHAYDMIEHAAYFEVTGDRRSGAGVANLPHRWEWPE